MPIVGGGAVREGKDIHGFNAAIEKYEDLVAACVIDPAKVTRTALQNAASRPVELCKTICFVKYKSMSLNIDTPDWLRRWGSLLLGYGVIGGVIFGANQLFGQFGWHTNVIGLAVLTIAWTFGWTLLEVRPPRNTSDRFGIGIFILTESEKGRLRLENDLLHRMNDTIQSQGLGDIFEFVLATNAQAKKHIPLIARHKVVLASANPSAHIKDHKRFARFKNKANCQFFVWGTLTERNDGGKTALILKSDALILHAELAPFRKRILEDQFKWIREFKIDEDAEYQGLQFAADELVLMADLVVGSAAAMVGNAVPALAIHERLLEHLNRVPETPSRKAIKKHVTAMIADELSVLAVLAYEGAKNADLAKEYLHRAFELKPHDHNSLILLAKIQFEHDGDAESALVTTHKMKPAANGIGIWRYNIAFLEMFNGNYKASWRMYQEIFSTTYPGEDETVSQVIIFNEAQAKVGFLPSLLIVGILYAKKIGNYPEGLRYLETFLEQAAPRNDFSLLRTWATDMRIEVMGEMRLSE
ncbi:MAG: hypothetical protein IPL32_14515 [Chloracidobacterium sp.]|nr:hypothetical protein [Chloracidobacterium sp.]